MADIIARRRTLATHITPFSHKKTPYRRKDQGVIVAQGKGTLQGRATMKLRAGSTSVAQTPRTPSVTRCDGKTFVDFLVAGTYFLRKYRADVNDLNVFPVPDGDTGTNMFLTVRAAMLEARRKTSSDLATVAAAAAQGSLMGARGNSGVIISQMFRGFAHAVRHRSFIETRDLAGALSDAVHAARQSLLKPVEGTILSVASATAAAALKTGMNEPDFFALLHILVAAASEALERTPEQLPILKEAKVVDAGGQGYVYFLEGALRFLRGRAPYTTAFPRRPVRRRTFTAQQRVEERRFCTEFMLTTDSITAPRLRDLLADQGDSLIVASGEGTLRVHIHTDFPTKVMDLAREFGDVSKTKVDNMEEQHNVLVVDRESKPRGIVTVVNGDGFAKICKELGADVTVLAGAAMNPSVKDLLVAVNQVVAPVVYVFPNDGNVIAAAHQIQPLTDRKVVVVPTRSMPDGIAAMFSLINQPLDRLAAPDDLLDESTILASGEIFRAVRDSSVSGVSVCRGELVGSIDARDGSPRSVVSGGDASSIALKLVEQAGAHNAALVTIYYGASRKLKDAESIVAALQEHLPNSAIEAYYGGQQSSDYVISIER
jgi:DAK2 domain fusion protein YloV